MDLNTIVTLNANDTEKCIDFYYTRSTDFETINLKGFLNNTDINIGLRIEKETHEKLYMIFDTFYKKNCDSNVICPTLPDTCTGVFGLYSFTQFYEIFNIIVEPEHIKYKDLYDSFYNNLQIAIDYDAEAYIKCIKFNLEKDNTNTLWSIFYPTLSKIHKRKIPDIFLDLVLRKLNYYGYTKELSIINYELLYTATSIKTEKFEDVISGLLIYVIDYILKTKYKDDKFLEKVSRIVNDLSSFYFENIY